MLAMIKLAGKAIEGMDQQTSGLRSQGQSANCPSLSFIDGDNSSDGQSAATKYRMTKAWTDGVHVGGEPK